MNEEFTTTKDGRAIKRNSESIIAEVLNCVESGLSIDQTVERCTPLYMVKYPDKVGQLDFKIWINKRVMANINWAKRKL